jgi:FtsP/CotA-like multicopper oxidase with cupredoxin domain
MSRNQRLALVVAALAVAVIAFVIVSPGGDDDGNSDSTSAVETAPTRNDEQPDDGVGLTDKTTPDEPAPTVVRIQIAGGEVEGGVKSIKVTKGDRVRIVVAADAADTLHLHGYDIEKTAEPGRPAVFAFTANLEGVYELESHTAEDAGLEPAVARLAVEPS